MGIKNNVYSLLEEKKGSSVSLEHLKDIYYVLHFGKLSMFFVKDSALIQVFGFKYGNNCYTHLNPNEEIQKEEKEVLKKFIKIEPKEIGSYKVFINFLREYLPSKLKTDEQHFIKGQFSYGLTMGSDAKTIFCFAIGDLVFIFLMEPIEFVGFAFLKSNKIYTWNKGFSEIKIRYDVSRETYLIPKTLFDGTIKNFLP